ncbi:MAG: SRPBCC domain-containing protein [Gemmatimonadaceae bacterium]
MTSFTHTHSWTLPASPDTVFRALTDPRELTQWFAEDAQIEPRVNGVYRFWGRHTLGTPAHDAARQTITRFELNRVLAFSWPINEVDTDVTIVLEPVETGTTLTLTHDVSGDLGVPRQRALIDDHWRLAIANLSTHLSGGTPIKPDYFAGTAHKRTSR